MDTAQAAQALISIAFPATPCVLMLPPLQVVEDDSVTVVDAADVDDIEHERERDSERFEAPPRPFLATSIVSTLARASLGRSGTGSDHAGRPNEADHDDREHATTLASVPSTRTTATTAEARLTATRRTDVASDRRALRP